MSFLSTREEILKKKKCQSLQPVSINDSFISSFTGFAIAKEISR